MEVTVDVSGLPKKKQLVYKPGSEAFHVTGSKEAKAKISKRSEEFNVQNEQPVTNMSIHNSNQIINNLPPVPHMMVQPNNYMNYNQLQMPPYSGFHEFPMSQQAQPIMNSQYQPPMPEPIYNDHDAYYMMNFLEANPMAHFMMMHGQEMNDFGCQEDEQGYGQNEDENGDNQFNGQVFGQNPQLMNEDQEPEIDYLSEFKEECRECECCSGFVNNCKGEVCANLGHCHCVMRLSMEENTEMDQWEMPEEVQKELREGGYGREDKSSTK